MYFIWIQLSSTSMFTTCGCKVSPVSIKLEAILKESELTLLFPYCRTYRKIL